MKHLSKEKKQHLLLVVLGTIGVLIGIWFGLINWQQERLAKLAAERDATRIKLEGMSDMLKKSSAITQETEREIKQLERAEAQMASGDLYAWIYNTVRGFKGRHPNVEIPQYSTILVGETTLLPKFPYQQATMTVAGRAFYHDLGTFIADLENELPYVRVQNLEIDPAQGSEGGYTEKLSFRMDLVTLVKPEA
jgi:Tfp pilus assembly protein PilO